MNLPPQTPRHECSGFVLLPSRTAAGTPNLNRIKIRTNRTNYRRTRRYGHLWEYRSSGFFETFDPAIAFDRFLKDNGLPLELAVFAGKNRA